MTGRTTYKNAPPAGRVAWTGLVEGTGDGEHLEMWMTRRVSRIGGAANERLQASGICGGAAFEESGSDNVRARFQREANVATLVDFIAKSCHVDEICFEIRLATHAERMHTLAVNGVFDLMLVFQATCDA